jgi:hypothetical protein
MHTGRYSEFHQQEGLSLTQALLRVEKKVKTQSAKRKTGKVTVSTKGERGRR